VKVARPPIVAPEANLSVVLFRVNYSRGCFDGILSVYPTPVVLYDSLDRGKQGVLKYKAY
jgi:hypothetical protein